MSLTLTSTFTRNGQSETRVIEGAGGGGKGGGSAPREAADSLFSNSTGQVVDLLSEGEIEGLVGGKEGLYYNETPYQINGTNNFYGATIVLNYGTEDQPALPGFDDVRTSVPVDQELPFDVYTTISFPNDGLHTAAEVTISTNNFFKVEDDGDTVGTNVTFVIEISENGGAFVEAVNATISGKQKDEYNVAYRIPIGDTDGNTAIRVKRTKPDSVSLRDNDEITFKLYTKITEHMLAYPNCAVAGHQFDAKQFGNRVPTRQYHLRGIKVNVPSNYDAVNRNYNGAWDGLLTTTPVYTNNPAWIFYDLVTNSRYGLGQFFDPAYIDLPSLYNIGRWCDDLIYKGNGVRTAASVTKSANAYTVTSTNHGFKNGDYIEILENGGVIYAKKVVYQATADTFVYFDNAEPAAPTGTVTVRQMEPRWACNTVINRRGEAFNVIKEMVSCFRGILFWMESKLWAMADQPQDAIKVVTNANVIDGTFTYSGESNRRRYSVVKVAWNDPAIMYRRGTEVYEDADLIREIGWKPVDYGAFGCTSRSQARRLAKAILYEQENGSEIVTYRASFDHSAADGDNGPVGVAPGDIIYVADSERGNAVAGGRILSVSGSVLTLDRDTGATDTGASVYIEHADGTMETVACDYSNDQITLTGTPTGTVAANDLFILIESGAQAEPFRVVKISEVDEHLYEVAAVRWDEGKFADVYAEEEYGEDDIMVPPDPTYAIAPTGPISFTESYVYSTDIRTRTLELAWTATTDEFLHYYEVSYSKDGDNWVTLPPTSTPGIKIEGIRSGTYEFRVATRSRIGVYSEALEGTYVVDTVPTTGTLDNGIITGLALEQGGTTFSGRDAKLTWTLDTPMSQYLTARSVTGIDQGIADPNFRDCIVRVRQTDNTLIREDSVIDTMYAYTWEKNAEDNGGTPLRDLKFDIHYRDVYGRESIASSITVNNPAPTFPSAPTATGVAEGVVVSITEPTDLDYVGVKIYMALSSVGVTTNPSDLVYQGPSGSSITLPAIDDTEHQVIVVPYDIFGDGTASATLTATPTVATDGLNNATVYIYQRSASTPTLPSVATTYTFATGSLSGLNNGWSTTIPAGTDPLYVSVATASSSSAADTIASGEWAGAVVLAQDGADGTNGTDGVDGLNTASVFIYQRASSAPTLPSVSTTYTFSTGALTGLDNGWTTDIPTGPEPLYVSQATASNTSATDSIPSGEWSTPRVLAQNGYGGTNIGLALNDVGADQVDNTFIQVTSSALTQTDLVSDHVSSYSVGYLTTDTSNVAWGARLPLVIGADDIWECTAVYERIGGNFSVRMGFYAWDETGTVVSNNSQGGITTESSDGVYFERLRIGGANVSSSDVDLKVAAAATMFRPHFRVNASTANQGRIYGIFFTKISGYARWADVTGSARPEDYSTSSGSGANLVRTPHATNGVGGWVVINGSVEDAPTGAVAGARSFSLLDGSRELPAYDVIPAGRYRLRFWAKTIGCTGTASFVMRDSTGVLIAGFGNSPTLAAGLDWTFYDVEVTNGVDRYDACPAWDLSTGYTGNPLIFGLRLEEVIPTPWDLVTDNGARPDDFASAGNALNAGYACNSLERWWEDYDASVPISGNPSGVNYSIQTPTDVPAGNSCLQMEDTDTGFDGIKSQKILLDHAKTYRLSCWARQLSGDRNQRLAVFWFDENEALITAGSAGLTGWAGNGTHTYWVSAGGGFPSSWTYYQQFFGASGATVPANAKYFVIGTYGGDGGTVDSVVQLAGYKVEDATLTPWSLVPDDGNRPADNATVNNVTYDNTAPSSPVNGDIWVDTSSLPYEVNMRVGGAWQLTSNLVNNTGELTDDANLGGTAAWSGVSGRLVFDYSGFDGEGDINDPDFEYAAAGDSASGWPGDAGTRVTTATGGEHGGAKLTITANGAIQDHLYRQYIPCQPGDLIYIRARYRANGITGSTLTNCFGTTQSNPDESSLGFPASSTAIVSDNTWRDFSGIVVITSGKTKYKPRLSVRNDISSGTLEIDYVQYKKISGHEVDADVTKVVTGTSAITIAYDSSGTIKSGQTPKTRQYTLETSTGTTITSGITWSVSTTSGTWSGTAPSMSGTGTGTLSINSGPASAESVVSVKATYEGREYLFPVTVSRVQDPAEVSTQTQAFRNTGGQFTTTWTDISSELVLSTGLSSTEVVLTASGIQLEATAYGASGDGAANCELRWLWHNGSSFVVVGTADASNPDPDVVDEGGGLVVSNVTGLATCNETQTGLSTDTEYRFKLQARIESTSGTNTITGVTALGSISADGA